MTNISSGSPSLRICHRTPQMRYRSLTKCSLIQPQARCSVVARLRSILLLQRYRAIKRSLAPLAAKEARSRSMAANPAQTGTQVFLRALSFAVHRVRATADAHHSLCYIHTTRMMGASVASSTIVPYRHTMIGGRCGSRAHLHQAAGLVVMRPSTHRALNLSLVQ